MSRSEVHLSEIAGQISFTIRRAPIGGGRRQPAQFLGCEPGCAVVNTLSLQPLPAGTVRQVGEHLLDRLGQHAQVQQALQHALMAPNNQTEPLYLFLDSPMAEDLPWESLFDAQRDFLALDRRWPVVRVVEPVNPYVPTERLMSDTVRFAFLLSAQGTPALPEWTRIWQKLGAAPFPIDVLLLVGEDAVFNAATTLNDARLHVERVGDATSLFNRLSTFAPHFLHLFCHGSTTGGPHFQVARREDHATGRLGYDLEAGQLVRDVPALRTELWLATLNVCQSGAGGPAGYSLASSLVTEGLPAVIGMRELVVGADASVFSAAFYEALVLRLQQIRAKAGQTVDVEWGELLQPPRHLLVQQMAAGRPVAQAAADAKEWTQPVLYVRPEDFRVRVPGPVAATAPAPPPVAAAPGAGAGAVPVPVVPPPVRVALGEDERAAAQAQLDVLVNFRNKLAHDTPVAVVQDIDARIHELRARLGLD